MHSGRRPEDEERVGEEAEDVPFPGDEATMGVPMGASSLGESADVVAGLVASDADRAALDAECRDEGEVPIAMMSDAAPRRLQLSRSRVGGADPLSSALEGVSRKAAPALLGAAARSPAAAPLYVGHPAMRAALPRDAPPEPAGPWRSVGPTLRAPESSVPAAMEAVFRACAGLGLVPAALPGSTVVRAEGLTPAGPLVVVLRFFRPRAAPEAVQIEIRRESGPRAAGARAVAVLRAAVQGMGRTVSVGGGALPPAPSALTRGSSLPDPVPLAGREPAPAPAFAAAATDAKHPMDDAAAAATAAAAAEGDVDVDELAGAPSKAPASSTTKPSAVLLDAASVLEMGEAAGVTAMDAAARDVRWAAREGLPEVTKPAARAACEGIASAVASLAASGPSRWAAARMVPALFAPCPEDGVLDASPEGPGADEALLLASLWSSLAQLLPLAASGADVCRAALPALEGHVTGIPVAAVPAQAALRRAALEAAAAVAAVSPGSLAAAWTVSPATALAVAGQQALADAYDLHAAAAAARALRALGDEAAATTLARRGTAALSGDVAAALDGLLVPKAASAEGGDPFTHY